MKTEYKTLDEVFDMITDPFTGYKRPVRNTDESFGNTEQLSSKALHLEQDREILKSFIVRHHPEMEGWVVKNFGRVKDR